MVTQEAPVRRTMLRRVLIRLAIGAAGGVLAWLVSTLVADLPWVADLLVGYVAFGLVFALPMLVVDLRLDAAQTEARMGSDSADAGVADLVVILSALASLLAVGDLVLGTSAGGKQAVVEAVIGLVAVGVGWVCIHTVYALRYARLHYYGDIADIDFNTDEPPRFSDFAYFSFNLGMTYQVSDTATRTSALRRIVLGHCVLSWLYGVVIIGTTINLVVSAGSGG
ncbi:DUF1345 domain-containing protein [Aestuariimicrobium soli]|uniref:DUF1345 domain-containing protein n=1 Tax=Aestuariimicrobium soli TaxID=2035834 RepID=UPI003EBA474A